MSSLLTMTRTSTRHLVSTRSRSRVKCGPLMTSLISPGGDCSTKALATWIASESAMDLVLSQKAGAAVHG